MRLNVTDLIFQVYHKLEWGCRAIQEAESINKFIVKDKVRRVTARRREELNHVGAVELLNHGKNLVVVGEESTI